ncbi:MAG: M43 family zinc metalloprotease, partial [Cyclobacteriaceae bacterium]|nr:M43 family zinc metalloprotease [Cyclobacteriaceae bacterium]
IDVLNEDFRRQFGSNGYNTHPDGADIEIEFCLANVNENGNPITEPGINRVRGNKSAWSRTSIEGELKPSTIWNPNYFYNIWTVNFAAEDALLLGYAQFPTGSGLPGLPDTGGSSTDGVVLKYTVVGSVEKGTFPIMEAPNNRGRTLTHETGHWLGLRHIWGDGPCGSDDFCFDTPESAQANRGCPIGIVSCSSTDMVENYMDYTDDACMNIFTQDQKARVLAVMQLSPRRGILTQAQACGVTVIDPPVAAFTSDINQVLLGGTVKFTDLSSNFPNFWEWTFEGGEPGISNSRNPVVTYNTPGLYKVSLTSSNAIGSSNLLEIVDYIFVSDQGLCNVLSNFQGGTPSVLRLQGTGEKGFVAGHNSLGQTAISEFFDNDLGYQEMSGVEINFGKVYSLNPDARARVFVWNALGPQNAPGRVLEETEVLFKQIEEDVLNNQPTRIYFGRRVPLFLGTAFHVGIEFDYQGDSLAIVTTADGENTNQTSWGRDKNGAWEPNALKSGLNIAHFVEPIVGMKSSVQISASNIHPFKGNEVTLNATGASIFSWTSSDGKINQQLGPQIKVVVRDLITTYTVTGSGLDLCIDQANIKLYLRESPVSITPENTGSEINLYPNPAEDYINFSMENIQSPEVLVGMYDLSGNELNFWSIHNENGTANRRLDLSQFPSGIYFLRIYHGNEVKYQKIIKH